jgi:hypothetical protein
MKFKYVDRSIFKLSALLLPLLAALTSLTLRAQSDRSALEARCWARSVDQRTRLPSRSNISDVNFSSVQSGFKVYSPFKVDFSVRGVGVAPAGKPVAGTGHHHVLIDRKLPADATNGLPFDANHMHFEKGQTSATLNLPVGKHTLRLLFANHDHMPYYVFSPEVVVEVVGQRSELIDGSKLTIREDRFD